MNATTNATTTDRVPELYAGFVSELLEAPCFVAFDDDYGWFEIDSDRHSWREAHFAGSNVEDSPDLKNTLAGILWTYRAELERAAEIVAAEGEARPWHVVGSELAARPWGRKNLSILDPVAEEMGELSLEMVACPRVSGAATLRIV